MDAPYSRFLDDTSTSTSPAKTSTVAKENIKWNEEAFFKRPGLSQASESLFAIPAESPISASNEATTKKDFLPKPTFDLNGSSFISDKANSSLGILNIENFSEFGDSSFQSSAFVEPNKKKKLERTSRVSSKERSSLVESEKFELSATAQDIFENFESAINDIIGESNSSSDLRYVASIPEINMDFEALSLSHSKENTSFSSYKSQSKLDESTDVNSSTFTRKESDINKSDNSFSEFSRSKLYNSSCPESADNTCTSNSFNQIQSPNESLCEQLTSEETALGKIKKEKIAKTIKVNPFLGISSFEIEPILQKSVETTVSSSPEITRCNKELSLDFCPEQISARSSSFGSSMRYDSPKSEIANISYQNKSSFSIPKMFLPKEDLEDEVLSGSHLQLTETKFDMMDDNLRNYEDKDPEVFLKSASRLTENIPENMNRLSDLPLESEISENSSGFANEENLFSQLGLSESDFFNSEAAKEILDKGQEMFEKEQFLQSRNDDSNWSPPSKLEVTAPSWFAETNSSQLLDSDRHISLGTLISARSEKLGTLSEDKDRERPFFGVFDTTPPKDETFGSTATQVSVDGTSPTKGSKIPKHQRISCLSDILEDISLSDPVALASRIIEKCEKSKKSHSNQTITKNSDYINLSEILENSDRSAVGDSEESATFVQTPGSNKSRETYTDFKDDGSNINRETCTNLSAECKSAMGEDDASTLSYSIHSSSERGSVKTAKSDVSSCSLPSTQHGANQEFSRPASVCSSTCSSHIPSEKTLSLHCMKYLTPGVESNQNGLPNSIQAGSNLCSHVCLHNMQPNFLPLGACNAFQSVIQNTLHAGSLITSGFSVPPNAIQVPSELYFPEKIAVGDSQEMMLTIRNSIDIVHYRISCVSAYLNDSALPDGMCGLNFCSNVPCSVGNVTHVKLIIAPKYQGKFEVNLQIDAFVNPVGLLNTSPGATVKTKIQYTAIRPSITIHCKEKHSLDMGMVIAGSSFIEYVTVTNNSEVAVPLKISLSNDTENLVSFGLNELDHQKQYLPGILRFLSPTVLLYRMPALKDKNMTPSLNIPVAFESIKGPFTVSINAAIETPTLYEVLGFVKISAAVGNARLILKDNARNPLVLNASKEATCSRSVTVMNEGSMSVIYDIYIDGDNNVLSVSPNSLDLKPNQSASVTVTFVPETYSSVKGKLLAAAQPCGQVFVLTEIIGHFKETYPSSLQSIPHIHNIKPTRSSIACRNVSSCAIECDKKYLAWGGIGIGSNKLKTCTIRNSKEESVLVKIFIKEKSKAFMLLDESNQKTLSYELTLNAGEAKNLSVIFIPKDVLSYSGYLHIKPNIQNESVVYMIPLSGYGGTSDIKVLDLSNVGKGVYSLDFDATIVKDNMYKSIVLHNTGLRPAFIKLFATDDYMTENSPSKHILITPTNFVLLEKEKKNVMISVNSMQQKQFLKDEVINILYGDEILRQRLKKSKCSSSANGNIHTEKFIAYFDGEEKIPFDSSYRASPKDEVLFHNGLKKVRINVFCNEQNKSFSRMSFGPLSEIQGNLTNMTFDSTVLTNSTTASKFRRLTIENTASPVKESSIYSENRLSLQIPFSESLSDPFKIEDFLPSIMDNLSNIKLDTWSVNPTELIIDADNKEKRILLKSHSSSDMRFKVEYSLDVITVSPVSGILSARGEIGLRLTLINSNQNKLLNDYHGNIRIFCDGSEKNISVIVSKDKKSKSASNIPAIVNDSLRSEFLGESDFLESTVIESISKSLNIESIFQFPKEINLYAAKVGTLSETVLNVTNPTKEAVVWEICPRSLMFAEPSEDSVDCTHSAIEFSNTSGTIKPMATENIVIKFFPQRVACFQQFFKLTLIKKSGANETFNIKVQGKAEADMSFIGRHFDAIDNNKGKSSRKKSAKSELYTESDTCNFSYTVSGQKSRKEIIVKNVSSQDFKLSIIKPQQPFSINYSSCIVKSRKFYRIPVNFKPLKPGKFESDVRFISDNGIELKVHLTGACEA